MSKAIYCNWHKGPQHEKHCANPTQCYCSCHQPAKLTNRKLKVQIEMHETRAKELRKVLESRPI